MANNFILRLDTTPPGGPAVELNGGAAFTTDPAITASLSTTDPDTLGYQVKVWGDVDESVNPSIQTDEGDSAWIAWADDLPVTLSAGDGPKNLHFKFRDDVGNATATIDASISYDSSLPVITITVAPDRLKISKVPGFDTSTFTFTANEAISAWKIKVVPDENATHDQGTTIPEDDGSTNMTGGALAGATPQAASINGADLETASAGDGDKTVKVFGQDATTGNWSV